MQYQNIQYTCVCSHEVLCDTRVVESLKGTNLQSTVILSREEKQLGRGGGGASVFYVVFVISTQVK